MKTWESYYSFGQVLKMLANNRINEVVMGEIAGKWFIGDDES